MKPWVRSILVQWVGCFGGLLGLAGNTALVVIVLKQLGPGPFRSIWDPVIVLFIIVATAACAYLSSRWVRSFLERSE